MGMLKSISLENYKCFKDRTDIEIAPLTVFCGVNSSGKSSILKSLLMLKQSYENDSSTQSLLLSGKYVDNGTFDDIVYHINKSSIDKDAHFKISNSFLIRDTSDEKGRNLIKRQDIASFRELKKIFYSTKDIKKVKAFKLSVIIDVLRPNESDTKNSFEFYIESNIINSYKIDIELLDSENNIIDTEKHFINVHKDTESDKGWLLDWEGIPSTKLPSTENKNYECVCYFSGLQIKNIYADNMRNYVRFALPNILAIFKISAFQCDGINFIAPLRQHPERRYALGGNVNSVGVSGENMPVLLASEYNKKKTDVIPPYFGNKSDIGEENLIWEIKRDEFGNLVKSWMDYLNLGDLSLSLYGTGGLIEIGINNHNIVDVGFGVSQALPIIVQGLYMTKDQSLLLEQPEIHLHPEMQLRMADFLIALAKNEKNIIVETHSDHIINRIIKRAMENPTLVNGENPVVKIIFLDRDEELKSTKIDIQIDKYKGVINGSRNFFTQFGSETMNISRIGYENYKREKDQ